MPNGQLAGWLAWSSVLLVAIISGFFARSSSLINRRTSTEQMFLELLKAEKVKTADLEKEKAALETALQTLRQENIKGMIAQERLDALKQAEIATLKANVALLKRDEQGLEETGET